MGRGATILVSKWYGAGSAISDGTKESIVAVVVADVEANIVVPDQ
jgi:hypothetical protein